MCHNISKSIITCRKERKLLYVQYSVPFNQEVLWPKGADVIFTDGKSNVFKMARIRDAST